MRSDFALIIKLQAAIVLTIAALVYWVAGLPAVKSYVYGSLVAILVAALLAWRHKQSLRIRGAERVLRHMYKTVIERFISTILLLAIGFKLMELSPFWILAGFVLGQVAWLVAPYWIKLRTQNDK